MAEQSVQMSVAQNKMSPAGRTGLPEGEGMDRVRETLEERETVERRNIIGAHLHELGTTALVPFTNANPHVDSFRLKYRPLVIGDKSYTIQQSMDDRPVELQPLHPGMKWTGAAVWDPAIVLCQYLERNTHLFAQKRVLEVGAGHALVSVVLASLGAAHVVATDYSSEVLSLANANFELNFRQDPPQGKVEARALRWGSAEDMKELNGPFDLVVASDCVYKQDLFEPLLETLLAGVSEEGIVVLAHKPRGLREEKFFHKLKQRLKVLTVVGPDDLDASFLKSNVFIHLCRRRKASEL